MKHVVILCLADFAASAYNVCCAVNAIGRIRAHHIVLSRPPYDFPAETVCPIAFKKTDPKEAPNYVTARELIDMADLIHCWNNEREGFSLFANFPIPFNKVKTYTFTGSSYRLYHTEVNRNIRKIPGSRVIVQDPMFMKYLKEFPVEFIPHAIDTDKIQFAPLDKRVPKTIGIYNKSRPVYVQQLTALRHILDEYFPEWQLVPGTTKSWWDRLQELSTCSFFYQGLPAQIGYVGRSAWELMSMGIPVFGSINPWVFEQTDRLGDIPLLQAAAPHLKKSISDATENMDYVQCARKTRKWVVDTLGYMRVGEEYTKLFEDALQ